MKHRDDRMRPIRNGLPTDSHSHTHCLLPFPALCLCQKVPKSKKRARVHAQVSPGKKGRECTKTRAQAGREKGRHGGRQRENRQAMGGREEQAGR